MSVADGYYAFDNDLNSILAALNKEYVVSGCVVSQADTPAVKVKVATGTYMANGRRVSISVAAEVNLTPAHASKYRKDLIVGDENGTLSAVEGVVDDPMPSAQAGPNTFQPAPPDIPASKVLLAEVWVEPNETTILNADITDRRAVVNRMRDASIRIATDFASIQAAISDLPT